MYTQATRPTILPFGYERATCPSTIWLIPKIASPKVETNADVGNATRRSWTTHSTGHHVIFGPMCVAGRQPQIHSPAAVPSAIVARKIATCASAIPRSIWPAASATMSGGPTAANAHHPQLRFPRRHALM
jgi:hypothetical protein